MDIKNKLAEDFQQKLDSAKLFEKSLSISRTSLIIFDECHHGTKNDLYNTFLKTIYFKEKIKPRVIGFSASLVKQKVKTKNESNNNNYNNNNKNNKNNNHNNYYNNYYTKCVV